MTDHTASPERVWASALAGFLIQMRMSGLSPLAVVSSALGPLAYAIVVTAGAGQPSDALLLGSVGAAVWGSLQVQSAIVVMQERSWGTLQALAACPTPLWAPLYGRLMAAACQALAAVPLIFVVLIALFGGVSDIDLAAWTVTLAVLVVGLVSMSLLLLGAFVRFRYAAGVVNGLFGVIVLLGGFFVPLAAQPAPIRTVGYLLPTSWALDAVWTDASPWRPLAVAAALAAVWLVAGSAYLSSAQRRLRRTGTYVQ